MNLENFSLNILYSFMYYNTVPLRESLGKLFSPKYCDRTWFLLFPRDANGKDILPPNFDPLSYRDDVLFILTGFFAIFSLSMSIYYIRGVKTGKLYID